MAGAVDDAAALAATARSTGGSKSEAAAASVGVAGVLAPAGSSKILGTEGGAEGGLAGGMEGGIEVSSISSNPISQCLS